MASQTRNSSGWPQVVLVAVIVLVVGIVLFWPYLNRAEPAPEVSPVPNRTINGDNEGESLVRSAAEAAQACVSGRWQVIIDRARAAAAAGPDRLWVFVWTLFTALDALETGERQDALRAFFETGRDVQFGTSFAVGSGGWLRDWPTLRTALFDYVAQRTPDLAQQLAVELLKTRPEEPGEWALALRELVRGRPAAEWSSLVHLRVREFILDRPWAEKASASWAEGFDVLVAGRSPDHLKDLAQLSASDLGREAKFVAFLTSDRLVMAAPAACLEALNRDPSLFGETTGVRAGLFARADVRDPVQLGELVRYFGRDDVGPGERAQFAAIFPHLSTPPTHRLLTQAVTRSVDEVNVAEAATLEHLDAWSAAGEFSAWSGTFEEIRRRLKARAEDSAPKT